MKAMETLVFEFGEIDDSAVFNVESAAISSYTSLMQNYTQGSIDGSVSVRNIGKGADWSVIVLTITGIFFAIPEAHKKVRESFEEWQHIFKELKSLYTWLIPKKIALYPNQYLFLIALNAISTQTKPRDLIFLGFTSLPEQSPDLDEYPALLFSFANKTEILQIAIARNGEIFWENKIQLVDKNA